jgi:hypothetical protein
MSKYSNKEYAARTLVTSKSMTKFLDAWQELTIAGNMMGFTKDELEKKEAMDKAIADFAMSFNNRLGGIVEGLKKEHEGI